MAADEIAGVLREGAPCVGGYDVYDALEGLEDFRFEGLDAGCYVFLAVLGVRGGELGG